MVGSTIDVDINQVVNALEMSKKMTRQDAKNIVILGGDIFIIKVRDKLPKGSLRDSIGDPMMGGIYTYFESASEIRLDVGSKLPEAVYLEYGVPAHMIIAKNSKALVFETPFGSVFTKYARHPGFKGKFYMTISAEETKQELMRKIK